jgi:hypothetical protein
MWQVDMQSFFSPFLLFKLGIVFSPNSWGSLCDKLLGGRLSRRYLEKHGIIELLKSGSDAEITIVTGDLARIHRLIVARKPEVVLEFGVGFSTIVIAHALKTVGVGTLYTLDADAQWLENTRAKLGESLAGRVVFNHSEVECAVHEGQLVVHYAKLPNIVPQFIYLDGPSPSDVKGNVRGLDFPLSDGRYRHIVASDILLYESSLLTNAYVLVDRRYANVQFLRNNLKRKWKLHWDRVQHQVGFELRDITGRSTFHRTDAS